MAEEIRGITWDLWGEELSHEQTIQRIVNGGFPVKGGVALTMFAIVEGESGEFQRAWHINVDRNDDGTIKRRTAIGDHTYMQARSIDLGFMQFNVPATGGVVELEMLPEVVTSWVEEMFDAHLDLGDPVDSVARALKLWEERGFKPWYAYKPGTPSFHEKKTYGAKAFANWLVHSFVDKSLKMDYVK